ncbi:MAG: GNAT family N-acetyltransferase [Acidimicrobiia bacterium]|nr:GNAT family N-acetyltransferase [Acidimicrobiia bacterium]
MIRPLLRMERPTDGIGRPPPHGFRIDRYERSSHHAAIPNLYAAAFGKDPWPDDWDVFDEFDPHGVMVAVEDATCSAVGFAISFKRSDFGYVSVVAVAPAYRRRGLASALVGSAAAYLRSLGLRLVRIDAWEDSPPAVLTYERLGFLIYDRRDEVDD